MISLEYERPLEVLEIPDEERAILRGYAAQYRVDAPAPSDRRLQPSSKSRLLRAVARAYGLRTFVETGTNTGCCVVEMLAPPSPVDRVLTVECGDGSRGLGNFDRAAARLAPYGAKVTALYGDSAKLLPEMCRSFEGPALFWLDAHANGPEDPDPTHFPLRRELELLFDEGYARLGSVVCVDDIRFCGFGFWPTVAEVLSYGSEAVLDRDIARLVC